VASAVALTVATGGVGAVLAAAATSTAMKVALAGIAIQAIGIGMQAAGVLVNSMELQAAGGTVGGIGMFMTLGGISAGSAYKEAQKAGSSVASSVAGSARSSISSQGSGSGSGASISGPGATPRGSADGASVRRVSNQSNQTAANTPSSSGGSPGIGNNANRGRWTRLNSFLSKVGFGGRWTLRWPKANLDPAVVNQLDRSDIPKPPTPASI